MRRRLLLLAILLLAPTGCAWFAAPGPETAATGGALDPDGPEALLAVAAGRAEAALTLLARVRAAERPPAPVATPRVVPRELLRRVDIAWTGPLTGLAAALARKAGYRFRVAGPRPAQAAIVTLEARRRPLIELLREAGIDAGDQALLTVDARTRTVGLDWAERRRGGGGG